MKKTFLLICLILSMSLLTACKFEFKIGDQTYLSNTQDDLDNQDVENNFIDDLEKDSNNDNKDDDEKDLNNDNKDDDEKDLDSKNTIDKEDEQENDIVKQNPNSFAEDARFADVDNPIKMGDAGIILTTYYEDGEFSNKNTYMRIKEKLSKEKAAEIAEEYNKNAIITYELSDGIEWNGVLVEIDLKDYPVTSKYGKAATSSEPSLSIASIDDGSIKWNGAIYFMPGNIVEAVDKDQKLFQGDIFECYFVYGLPEGFDEEYLIKAYNYDSEEHRYTYFLMK